MSEQITHSLSSDLKVLTLPEMSEYFQVNSGLLELILNYNFDYKLLNNPILLKFISNMAQKTDTKYNKIYGGSEVKYNSDEWRDSFTDDFFTALVLFQLPNFQYYDKDFMLYYKEYYTEYTKKCKYMLIHMAWFFARIVTLTPNGPINVVETNPKLIVNWSIQKWGIATIRDRLFQMVPYDKLGAEQQKDEIPLASFNEAFDELDLSDKHTIQTIFKYNFEIPFMALMKDTMFIF